MTKTSILVGLPRQSKKLMLHCGGTHNFGWASETAMWSAHPLEVQQKENLEQVRFYILINLLQTADDIFNIIPYDGITELINCNVNLVLI